MKHFFEPISGLVLVALMWSGCDSGQYGQETKSQPKAESQPMEMAKTTPMEKAPDVEGALLAPAGVAGAVENDEGVKHFQQGHWDVAQEHFMKALAVNGELPEAHYNLALALDKLGEHGEATAHFKTALDLASDNPKIKESGILKAHVGG